MVYDKGYKILSQKFPLLFRQAKMVFVIVWLFDHFMLKPVLSMNIIGIVAFVNHLHVWVTKFKPSFVFSKLSVLTSNNVIWVFFSAILFDETQHVVKTSTACYVSVCYEAISLFIKPQNFMSKFFICKLKGLYLIIFFFDDLLMFFLYFVFGLLSNLWEQHIAARSSVFRS